MPFKSHEVAELTVGGARYHDWKTVYVYLCTESPNNMYRFTCSEGKPLAPNFAEHRIKPGDRCTVTLGGEYAIGGRVTVRQVAYTSTHHGVEITGKSETYKTVSAAAKVEGGELRQVSFSEMATKLLQPLALNFQGKGGISEEKFDRVNVQGQSVWEVMETHARARNIRLGTDPDSGDGYWGTTPGFTYGTGRVVEGQNILEGREIISQEFFGDNANVSSIAQAAPNPQAWGIINTQPFSGGAAGGIPLLSHLEVPGLKADAVQRSGSEATALSAEFIKLEIVVQGWFRGGNGQGGLWKPWDKVTVWSPMLIMDNVTLQCKSVTFTQDDRSGSRTTLELVNKLEGKPTV
jgi:prophage tail gpP-like protein